MTGCRFALWARTKGQDKDRVIELEGDKEIGDAR